MAALNLIVGEKSGLHVCLEVKGSGVEYLLSGEFDSVLFADNLDSKTLKLSRVVNVREWLDIMEYFL